MNTKIYQAVINIRWIAIDNINKPTYEQRWALSMLKTLTNIRSFNSGLEDTYDNDMTRHIDSISNIITTLVPDPKEDWEIEIIELWDDSLNG